MLAATTSSVIQMAGIAGGVAKGRSILPSDEKVASANLKRADDFRNLALLFVRPEMIRVSFKPMTDTGASVSMQKPGYFPCGRREAKSLRSTHVSCMSVIGRPRVDAQQGRPTENTCLYSFHRGWQWAPLLRPCSFLRLYGLWPSPSLLRQ